MSALVPAFLADLFLRSSLLLLIAWAASEAIGRSGGSAASRHLVWLLCLGALLLLPILSYVLPSLPLPILPADPVPATPAAIPAAAAPRPAEPAETPFLLGWAIYVLVAAALAARLVLGRTLLALDWRRARVSVPLAEVVDRLKARLGIRRRVDLRLGREPTMPMTWGMVRPRIMLPADAAHWPEQQRSMVLLHELGHVRRFDSPVRLVASLACALYWFNPALWIAVRRLRIEQELATDDLVVAAGACAQSYASSLLEFAAGRTPLATASLSAAMASRSELERRLTAIVAPGARRGPGSRFVAGTSVAGCVSALLVATVMPVAESRAVEPFAALPLPSPPAIATAPEQVPAASAFVAGQHPAIAPASALPAHAPVPAISASPPVAMVAPPPEPPPQTYAQLREIYDRELDAYHRQLAEYKRQVSDYHRKVEELRSQNNLANLGNLGNAGNSGNSGNSGNDSTPFTPPTSPTAPTPPTDPTPLRRVAQIPSVPALPSSQGP